MGCVMRTADNDDAMTSPAAFAYVLSEVFHGEPWDDIEPYAAKAWSKLSIQSWEDVRESVIQHMQQRLASRSGRYSLAADQLDTSPE